MPIEQRGYPERSGTYSESQSSDETSKYHQTWNQVFEWDDSLGHHEVHSVDFVADGTGYGDPTIPADGKTSEAHGKSVKYGAGKETVTNEHFQKDVSATRTSHEVGEMGNYLGYPGPMVHRVDLDYSLTTHYDKDINKDGEETVEQSYDIENQLNDLILSSYFPNGYTVLQAWNNPYHDTTPPQSGNIGARTSATGRAAGFFPQRNFLDDPLEWAYGRGGIWDVGASDSYLAQIDRLIGEGYRSVLGDEYLAKAGGWELAGLTTVSFVAAVYVAPIAGAAVGGGLLGAAVAGGVGAGVEYAILVGGGNLGSAIAGREEAPEFSFTKLTVSVGGGALGGSAGYLAGKVIGAGARGIRSAIAEGLLPGSRVRTPSNPVGLFSGGYNGRALAQAEVDAITAEFRAAGGVVDQSLAAQRYLHMRRAGGLTLNADTILLPANPTRTAVFEELVHAGQFAKGASIGPGGVAKFEAEAAEILIRNRHAWQLPNDEIRQVIANLRNYRTALGF